MGGTLRRWEMERFGIYVAEKSDQKFLVTALKARLEAWGLAASQPSAELEIRIGHAQPRGAVRSLGSGAGTRSAAKIIAKTLGLPCRWRATWGGDHAIDIDLAEGDDVDSKVMSRLMWALFVWMAYRYPDRACFQVLSNPSGLEELLRRLSPSPSSPEPMFVGDHVQKFSQTFPLSKPRSTLGVPLGRPKPLAFSLPPSPKRG